MAENILQLYADDEQKIKGYPITSAKLVMRENGRSMEDFDKDMTAKHELFEKEAEEKLKSYVDALPSNIKVQREKPENNNVLWLQPEELLEAPQEVTEAMLNRMTEHESQLADIAINIKMLGAKGDGVNDDTDIIQNAINTYSAIYIPKGTYKITKPISISKRVRIYGEDKIYTKLKTDIDISVFNISISYVSISNLTLEGYYTETLVDLKGVGINVNAGSTLIENVRVNYFKNSIIANNGLLSRFSKVLCYGFDVAIFTYNNSNNIVFDKCDLTYGNKAVVVGEGRNTDFINGHIENIKTHAIEVYDEGLVNIKGSYFESVLGNILYVKLNATPLKFKGFKECVNFECNSVYNDSTSAIFKIDCDTVLNIYNNTFTNTIQNNLVDDTSGTGRIFIGKNQLFSDPYSTSTVIPTMLNTALSPFGIMENLDVRADVRVRQPKILTVADFTVAITVDTFVPLFIYCDWLSSGKTITVKSKDGYTVNSGVINTTITTPTIYMLVWRGYSNATYSARLVKVFG